MVKESNQFQIKDKLTVYCNVIISSLKKVQNTPFPILLDSRSAGLLAGWIACWLDCCRFSRAACCVRADIQPPGRPGARRDALRCRLCSPPKCPFRECLRRFYSNCILIIQYYNTIIIIIKTGKSDAINLTMV